MEHLVNPDLETKIKVPKTIEEQLDQLIEGTANLFKANPGMKSNPLKALWRDGNLNKEFILREAELITQRKSTLSSNTRKVVITLLQTADMLFKQNLTSQTVSKDDSSDNNITEQ